jgi:hypothetical protein
MLNSWGGSLTIDEDNNTILAAIIGAGKKNSDDNTFSGVLMGDWDSTETDSSFSGTGLWGFHHGAASFGFSEDGTGFIGKSGSGRIVFDGDDGTIYSGDWKAH